MKLKEWYQAGTDTLAAYSNLSPASRPGGMDPGAGQLGGLTLPPWVFQMASTLTLGDPGTPRNVILTNGAQAKNVFWQVGSSATINAAGGGTMVGTIIALPE